MDTGTAAGLRERKKAATRQAIYQAALRLAMVRGLDRVTSEAVADAAGVSRRTFSNYFANKEEALLHGDRSRMRLLVDLVAARPAGESAWAALTASARELLAHMGDRDQDWVARARLIREHPSLVVRQVAMFAALERDLAAAISERALGDATGMRTRLMVAGFLVALREATNTWLDQPAGASLREIVDAAFEAIAAPFDPSVE